MDGMEQRIREQAFLLWEAEGRPEGREVEYWERAQRLIGAGETQTAGNGRESLNGASAAHQGARTGFAPAKPAAKSGGKRNGTDSGAAKPAKRKASRSK